MDLYVAPYEAGPDAQARPHSSSLSSVDSLANDFSEMGMNHHRRRESFPVSHVMHGSLLRALSDTYSSQRSRTTLRTIITRLPRMATMIIIKEREARCMDMTNYRRLLAPRSTSPLVTLPMTLRSHPISQAVVDRDKACQHRPAFCRSATRRRHLGSCQSLHIHLIHRDTLRTCSLFMNKLPVTRHHFPLIHQRQWITLLPECRWCQRHPRSIRSRRSGILPTPLRHQPQLLRSSTYLRTRLLDLHNPHLRNRMGRMGMVILSKSTKWSTHLLTGTHLLLRVNQARLPRRLRDLYRSQALLTGKALCHYHHQADSCRCNRNPLG
jgi:hypothetical protein